MTAEIGYVTTACRLSEDIVPPDAVLWKRFASGNNYKAQCEEPWGQRDCPRSRSEGPGDGDEIAIASNEIKVVICGAVPSMVRSVRLFSQCSHQYVNIFRNGSVMASATSDDQPNLTISTQGFDLKLLIHSPKENMYLCFNKRWKIVGRRISREEALRENRCLFYESMLVGYNTYSSVANASRYVGFNARGQQLRRPLQQIPRKRLRCVTFMKEDDSFDIGHHNSVLGGELRERPHLRRRHRPPAGNSLRQPCPEHLRHQSRHLRRKLCDGT